MPAFLYGTYRTVLPKSREEGQRHGEHFRTSASLSLPRDLQEVSADEVVITHEAVDLERERSAWRLYRVGNVADGLIEALDWQNSRQVGDAIEECWRGAPWGALYFAIAHEAPMSAARVALRVKAVLRSWDALRSARYLFSAPDAPLSLEELMDTSCGWALEAWGSARTLPMRTRLELAAGRMEQATREDSMEVIIQQMPRALSFARGLQHRATLADPGFLRQRLATLSEGAFSSLSAAWPAMLIRQLHVWDRQLEKQ